VVSVGAAAFPSVLAMVDVDNAAGVALARWGCVSGAGETAAVSSIMTRLDRSAAGGDASDKMTVAPPMPPTATATNIASGRRSDLGRIKSEWKLLSIGRITHSRAAGELSTGSAHLHAENPISPCRLGTSPLADSSEFRYAASLRLQEGQQVGVDRVGLRRRHAVRKILVGLQRPVFQQLRRQRPGRHIGNDLIVFAVHHQHRHGDLF
jgi:hypothetical protein